MSRHWLRSTSGIVVFSLTFSFTLQTKSAIAQSPENLSASDFGFYRSETIDSDSRTTVTLTDPSSGHILQTVYSPLGTIEFQSETTSSGRILSRREIRSSQEIREEFLPVHTRTIYQMNHPGRIAVEKTTWAEDTSNTETYEILEERALQECRATQSSSPLDRLLSNVSWLKFQPESRGAVVALGNNFVAENCASYPQGGIKGLARALTDGLQTGLSCLSRLGPERKMDAARLLAFLDSKFSKKAKIRCGHVGQVTGRDSPDPSNPGKYQPATIAKGSVAQAYLSNSPDFPALQINLDSQDLSRADNPAPHVLFHEMLHWLGYLHMEGNDVTYLSELCCFPSANILKENQNRACKLLVDQPSFQSEEYHRRFMEVMFDDARSNIALDAAWSAVRVRRDTRLLFASVLKLADSDRSEVEYLKQNYRESGNPLLYITLARASLGNLPPDKKKEAVKAVTERIDSAYPKGPVRDAALYVGDALNAIINHDSNSFKSAWAQFEKIKATACPLMSKHEKEELSDATNLAIVDYFSLKPRIQGYAEKLDKPCP